MGAFFTETPHDLVVSPALGGILIGFGFIIGGYCAGTSIVSAAKLKVDGMFFLAGHIAGVIVFGETVGFINEFWNSGYMGRFLLPELFGLETGVVALRGDWTRRDAAIAAYLERKGAAGVPLYVWIDSDGREEILPQVLTPDMLATRARQSGSGQ